MRAVFEKMQLFLFPFIDRKNRLKRFCAFHLIKILSTKKYFSLRIIKPKQIMRKNFLKIAAASILIISAGACSKNDNGGGPSPKLQLITKAGWRVVNMEFGNGSSWIQNPDWTNAPQCQKDDITVFKANMTYEENEGATKCDNDDPQVFDEGTWSFKDNETKIVKDGIEITITQLDNTTLQVVAPVPGSSTITQRVTLTH
jgi:hypothetical protein